MVQRHPLPITLPRVWLFSDERAAHPIAELAARLPPGSGIVVRHGRLRIGARWRLVRRLARIARARRLVLLLAGDPALARRWGVAGVHLRQAMAGTGLKAGARARAGAAQQAQRLGLVAAMPVHDRREAGRARRARATLAFISPLHATRSHPGAPVLGQRAWWRLARLADAIPIALGGMTATRARALRRAAPGQRIDPGWAAIDHWDEKAAERRRRQKRKAVPT